MIPEEYRGREQTWLKHRVLEEYLGAWAHKLGSAGRKIERPKLWYIDCFSGPWKPAHAEKTDTSVYIGLKALDAARCTWESKGVEVRLGAIFIEKSARAHEDLRDLVERHSEGIDAHTIRGEFGEHLADIQRLVGSDSAFLLVDPTGWDGAAMKYIAPLVTPPRRDVMINVMFEHINRFKDDERAFLRAQMQAFFGLIQGDLPPHLGEEELMSFYRERLRSVCRLPFVADLAVPHPSVEKTKFRLVVGGRHKEVLRLFRDVERKVIGEQAAVARTEARERRRFERDNQIALIPPEPPKEYAGYAVQREDGHRDARVRVPGLLHERGAMEYGAIWPVVLQDCHITEGDLGKLILELCSDGVLQVDGLKPRERTMKDRHFVGLVGRR